MKQRNLRKALLVLTVVFGMVAGTNAFAGGGMGYYGGGPGWRHMGPAGFDRSAYVPSNVSQEDWKKMDQEREAFFKETETLRQQIYEKEMALGSELAKTTPDAATAAEIQKSLSALQGQFDQKRLDHLLKMREITPGPGSGYMGGRGRIMGRGRGYMMGGAGPRGMMAGYGPMGGGYGNGPCWR